MACNGIFTGSPGEEVRVRVQSDTATFHGEQRIVDCAGTLIAEKGFSQQALEAGIRWTVEEDRIYRLYVIRSPASAALTVMHEFAEESPIVDNCGGGSETAGPWSVFSCQDQRRIMR